jgi:hypothetical protein
MTMGFSETPFIKGGRGDFAPEKNPQSLRDSSFSKELIFCLSPLESANPSMTRCDASATAMISQMGDGMMREEYIVSG